ncbi:MAG: prepilin-type N-terminal cleavage/methylation domain-containing protein [Bermanella sp.]
MMFHRALPNKIINQFGFTLIEIIVVMVVLSILAIGSVKFISLGAMGYVDTTRRSNIAATATLINEKISRLIRDALPGSIRVSDDQSCIEFLPVLAATQYIQAPFETASNEVTAAPLDNNNFRDFGYLSIYPITSDVNDIYDNTNSPGFVSVEIARIVNTVNGAIVMNFDNADTFRFLKRSPQKRLYVVDEPNAFCQIGNNLFYYRNYGFVPDKTNLMATVSSSVPNRLLIGSGIMANSLQFTYLPSSLRRNSIVAYELELQDPSRAEETLVVNQEIQIRNVP